MKPEAHPIASGVGGQFTSTTCVNKRRSYRYLEKSLDALMSLIIGFMGTWIVLSFIRVCNIQTHKSLMMELINSRFCTEQTISCIHEYSTSQIDNGNSQYIEVLDLISTKNSNK